MERHTRSLDERLASEEAALRRVATLVAQGAPSSEIFSAVSVEVARLVGADNAHVSRFDDDRAFIVMGLTEELSGITVGSRFEFDDLMTTARVHRTGRAARIDGVDWSNVDGAFGEAGRRLRVASSVSGPIVVNGHLWGVITVTSSRPLSPNTEVRLGDFTELVATAIANAESREALRQLADEQAALRRVATLVAQGVPPVEIFSAVSMELDRLFGSDQAVVGRFDPSGPEVVAVGVAKHDDRIPLGSRWKHNELYAQSRVFRTGRSARVDSHEVAAADGPAAEWLISQGFFAQIASPITVEGHLWGALGVTAREPFPRDAADRLEKFSELIGSAIANAEAREALERVIDEQTALRRVATLVARGVPAGELFQAVSEEVASVFGESLAAVGRSEADGSMVTIVGIATQVEGLDVGTRVQIHEETPTGMAYATGRSARVDREDWTDAVSELGHIAHHLGVVSWVTCPVVVESRLWGYLSVAARQPLPSETEQRLEKFTELVATAIANTESRSELAASRRRIVTASDEARRRIERNLHDGTQQRLVALALAVRAVEADAPADLTDLQSKLSQIATGLVDATAELQEISRGIHPGTLSQRGLGAALRTLARRSPVPVDLEITIEGRLPESVEVAAYYVTSEALANAAKHAQASRVEVSLTSRDKAVFLSIRDDGIGGADPVRGSGLVGLVDRVQALGGTIDVRSARGDGTRITTMLPLDVEASDDRGVLPSPVQ